MTFLGGTGRMRRAFSLAELMIALAILGFGLLIIGAALPVGVRYTQLTVDRDTAAAAADYAFGVLSERLHIPRQATPGGPHPSPIFVPRAGGVYQPNHVPMIKVRAMPLQNLNLSPTTGASYANWPRGEQFLVSSASYWSEGLIAQSLASETALQNSTSEVDQDGSAVALPSVGIASMVYPQVPLDGDRSPTRFIQSPYLSRPFNPAWSQRVASQRIGWTALYRRVSYSGDPSLFEVVVVVTRRPSDAYRFPVQRASTGGTAMPGYDKVDSLVPIPWLVTFNEFSVPPTSDPNGSFGPRIFAAGYLPPTSLTFRASEQVGSLLPPGSLFIPATNDERPTSWAKSYDPPGFMPELSDGVPIFEVVDRVWNDETDQYELTVKSNGYEPWVANNEYSTWPVWVIPPAFEQVDDAGWPVFFDQSPVVSVERRVVRVPVLE